MNKEALWNVQAAFNTIMMAHPLCECPTEEEQEAAQDTWCCEHCLCVEGLTELKKLFPELDKSGEKFPGYLGDVNGLGCDPDTV